MDYQNLLAETKNIILKNKEEEKRKGELFNVFSILKMESSENITHSRFIGELLNPNGTHLKGNSFLKLFLELEMMKNHGLDIDSCQVILEHYIGPKKDIEKTGGRIDIFIKDGKGKSISIENKIFAGDQDFQIVRYHNYKKGNNTVYYLTLSGEEPDDISKDNLKSGEHFHCLSYQTHIIKWLELCLKASKEDPILQTSIKQYLILIQKLTGIMNNKPDLIELILTNYEAASTIAANVAAAKQKIGDDIRQAVLMQLGEKLRMSNKYDVSEGKPKDYSYIDIKIKEAENKTIFFRLQSFTDLKYCEPLCIGMFSKTEKSPFPENTAEKDSSGWWGKEYEYYFTAFEGSKINLSNPATVQKIHTDEAFKTGFINHIVTETIAYLEEQTPPLLAFLNKE